MMSGTTKVYAKLTLVPTALDDTKSLSICGERTKQNAARVMKVHVNVDLG
jgi:hypothetical protein